MKMGRVPWGSSPSYLYILTFCQVNLIIIIIISLQIPLYKPQVLLRMNSMMIGGENESATENQGNASLNKLAELAVLLGNNIFDEEKVEEIIKKKKQDKKKQMIKKPTNIVLVINMKKGVSLKFKDYHPAPAIAI